MTSIVARTGASSARRRPLAAELWRYRELMRSLVVRHLKVKYQRSVLGFVWTLLNPLLTVAVLILVFHYIVKIRIPDYWAFLLSGYFVWNYLLQMLSASAYVVREHAALRRSVAFPSEVLILAAAAGRLVEFAVEMAVAVGLLVLFHHHGIPASFLLLPLLLLIMIVLAAAFMMPLATLAVFYDDVQHALPIVLLMLFYVSPVFYAASLVPERFRGLYLLNPIAGLLSCFHTVLYQGHWPAAGLVAETAATTLILFVLGYLVFNRYKVLFAEIA